MSPPTSITLHAVERYRQRHRPDLDHVQAQDELLDLIAAARPAGESTREQDSVWLSPGGVLLVVRPDGTVSTVLPPRARRVVRRPRRKRG